MGNWHIRVRERDKLFDLLLFWEPLKVFFANQFIPHTKDYAEPPLEGQNHELSRELLRNVGTFDMFNAHCL